MQLKYGSYSHAANECAIVISKDAEPDDYGNALFVNERWDVAGRIQAATQAAVIAKLTALEAAYRVNGRDLALYGEGGARTHSLLNSDTVEGVRVTRPPSYPIGEGAELSTFRNYALSVEGKRQVGAVSNIISYREAISRQGTGGPTWGYLGPLEGQPISQLLTQASVVTITQEGSAVGNGIYPTPPPPLWPTYELQSEQSFVMEMPARGSVERRISWRYVFQATGKLAGIPHYS